MKAYTLFLIAAFVPFTLMAQSNNKQAINVIETTGVATISVPADRVRMDIEYSSMAPTTKEARIQTNKVISQIIDTLVAKGVDPTELTTERLSIAPIIKWENNQNVVVAQQAKQILNIDLANKEDTSAKISAIIDEISNINQVTLSNLNFYRKDVKEFQQKSLELAFKDAQYEAKILADIAGKKLGKVIFISTLPSADSFLPPAAKLRTLSMDSSGGSGNTTVHAGSQEITTTVAVTFELND